VAMRRKGMKRSSHPRPISAAETWQTTEGAQAEYKRAGKQIMRRKVRVESAGLRGPTHDSEMNSLGERLLK
jgi:hypothetical protein